MRPLLALLLVAPAAAPLAAQPAPPPAQAGSIPVVLSTDIGNEIDDQWAVTDLLLEPRFHVLGITSAHAPTLPAPAARTSLHVLQNVVQVHLGMARHPPLIEGGSLPLADTHTPRPSPAVRFLLETSRPFSSAHRLNVLVIGASTDVASALLTDPSLADRIQVVQMGFNDEKGGDEYNILNDPHAEQVLLDSRVPLVIGPGSVCRTDLAMSYNHARSLLAPLGPIGAWLWTEYDAWYYQAVKPLRVDDFSKPWYIWDDITLAYLLGMTTQHTVPRPRLTDAFTFTPGAPGQTLTWITHVDSARFWPSFTANVERYEKLHPGAARP